MLEAGQKAPIGHAPVLAVVVRRLQELRPFKKEWNRLACLAPQQSPLLSHAWISSYLEHRLKNSESWFCVFACEGEKVLGVLPIVVVSGRLAGRDYPVLRVPGDKHTMAVDLLVAPDRLDEIVPLLIDRALEECPTYRYLEFAQLTKSSPILTLFQAGFWKRLATMEFCGNGSFLNVAGNFDDYRRKLSRNSRRNLKRKAARLHKLAGVRYLFLRGNEATEADLLLMAEVEDKSWKSEVGSSIVKSEELVQFYTTLCRRLSECGWLEWHFLEGDGKTIAAHLAIRIGRSIVLWKIGYDESYHSCSPGSMLFEELVRLSFDCDAIDEINLMTDMAWHPHWQAQKRQYFTVRLYSDKVLPVLLAFWPAKIKSLMRKIPGLRPFVRRVRRLARCG